MVEILKVNKTDMIPLNPEHREYKEKTLNQLLANLSILEAQLSEESHSEVVKSLQTQIDEIQAHIEHLKNELAHNATLEAAADELCKQAASALTKQKFYLAQKYLTRLETIEPFHPALDRLKQEVESGQVSRRTRSIARGDSLPNPLATPGAALQITTLEPQPLIPTEQPYLVIREKRKRGGILQFFQFHIVLSMLVVLLIICVVAGVGGMSLLEWLIEGG